MLQSTEGLEKAFLKSKALRTMIGCLSFSETLLYITSTLARSVLYNTDSPDECLGKKWQLKYFELPDRHWILLRRL